MIITITGDMGAGKSTLGEDLAKYLNFDRYYIGQIRRDAAKKMGMTLAEYNKYGETHPETDVDIDNYQKQIGQKKDNFVIEGRTSWFLIPQSIKLYLKVDPKIGAERIFKELQKKNNRNENINLQTIDDVVKSNQERMKCDDYRYKKYYKKDCFNEKNFDFVLDTTSLTSEDVLKKSIAFIKSQEKFKKN